MDIEIKAPDLRRVLGTTVLWAAEDDSRPSLMGVHLIVTKARLWAIGVDPYCMAYDSADCTADETGEVTLPREAVDFALREIAALPKKVYPETVARLTGAGISIAGAAFAYTSQTGFPNWRSVLPSAAPKPTTRVILNPHFTGRLQKVAKLTGVPMADFVFGGDTGIVDVQVGDTFRVLIMPMRGAERRIAEAPPVASEAAA